jgi:catalase
LTAVVKTAPGDRSSLLFSMKRMQEQLTQTIGTIKISADSIATATHQIAAGNQDLSQRTEEQAASLQETAASMEQLTSTVNQNADNASQAINGALERFWVKFHFRSQQGIENLTDTQAEALVGRDRETHHRDLYEAIERQQFPRWTMSVQIMPEKEAGSYPINPFDLTKVWPKSDYPLIEVGVVELNRNPENHFADVEQAAFSPANVVPGISFSPDRMLQGRLFSYGDAQRYRLSVNYHQVPVNAPRGAKYVHSYHRDGLLRVDANTGGATPYEPNTRGEWQQQPDYREPPLSLEGMADHWNHRVDDDYYSQPGALFRKMTVAQQQTLFDNTARALNGVSKPVQQLHIEHCAQADPAYGAGVAQAIAQLEGQCAWAARAD